MNYLVVVLEIIKISPFYILEYAGCRQKGVQRTTVNAMKKGKAIFLSRFFGSFLSTEKKQE